MQTYFCFNGTVNGVAYIREIEGTVEDFMNGYLCTVHEYERELRYRGTLDHVLANVASFTKNATDVEVTLLDGQKLYLAARVERAAAA